MDLLRPESLFLATALAHLSLAGYTMLRVRRRAPPPVEERAAFTTQPAERAVTQAAILLDPRAEAAEEEALDAGAGDMPADAELDAAETEEAR
jgi:hypothetical protein